MFLKLKVHTVSKTAMLTKKAEDAYEVWVRAPAENGRANKEALAALAKALGCAPARLHIVKGTTSPNKIVKLLGSEKQSPYWA